MNGYKLMAIDMDGTLLKNAITSASIIADTHSKCGK